MIAASWRVWDNVEINYYTYSVIRLHGRKLNYFCNISTLELIFIYGVPHNALYAEQKVLIGYEGAKKISDFLKKSDIFKGKYQ